MKSYKSTLLESFKSLEPYCSHIKLEFGRDVIEKDIRWREKQIESEIPDSIKDLVRANGMSVDFSWTFKDELLVPEAMEECTGGSFSYDLNNMSLTNWSGWKDSFNNYEDYGLEEAPKYKFEELFPFIEIINGDVIAVVVSGDDKGSIVYLDHEGEDLIWGCLGRTLKDFLDGWISIGCPGPESCYLAPFYDRKDDMLVTDVDNLDWLKFIEQPK
ncbi:hypothetical protein [Rubellicoccus peritrichatus]|uniref:Knr4/Smi1-like domain-containing protein n=1 Tax=Rubellicoccus peritrichatus TaxID=3080537 RepID=A0AAQ3LD13_9BACT|nr:hypothetical protein [Puniceicoccus sp. CR14]WOO41665.1 hypothetical protein RZN69_01095 [Puniceicoccus sp. CR14]